MFCKNDRDDDTYRPRLHEFGAFRAVGVEIGGAASHVIVREGEDAFPTVFSAMPQQQQSQQPQLRPLVLTR